MYHREGIGGLRLALKLLDPDHYARVDLHNPRRVMRALEISESTGKPYSSFLTSLQKERDFRILKAGLTRERPELFGRIDERVDRMIEAGLEDEVASLKMHRGLNALNTVGYREMFMYLDGEITRDQAIALIKRNTRRYTRRQITWWNRDKEIKWFDAGNSEMIKAWIDSQLNS
jgi:tRNA dimethylallyltransferase